MLAALVVTDAPMLRKRSGRRDGLCDMGTISEGGDGFLRALGGHRRRAGAR